ncbi:acyltransferase family protein [Bradyrhizobium sp. USDA 4472]
MSPPRTIFSIQILRGIAALFIVIGHGQSMARELAALTNRTFLAWSPVPWGVGVDLFFVISGFIIFYSSAKYENDAQPRRAFYAHRIARLVPLYWTATALFIALIATKKSLGFAQDDAFPTMQAIAASLLFLPIDGPGTSGLAFPVYDLGWTLNYEMYFYTLFALCLMRSYVQSATRVLACLCAVLLLGAVLKIELLPFAFWCQPIVLEFGCGILIAVAMRRSVSLPAPIRLALVVLGATLIVALPFGQPEAINGTYLNGWNRFYTLGLPAALVVAGAALGPDVRKTFWSAIPLQLGDASYSLYLLHPFVLFALSMAYRRVGLLQALPLPLVVIMLIVAASVVAILSYRLFERPSARLVSQWLMPGPAKAKPQLGERGVR